jgi:adenylate cyclase
MVSIAHYFHRTLTIISIAWLLGIGVNNLTNTETSVGLDTLFKIRGPRPTPSKVIIVTMDDAETENALKVGDQYLSWRGFQDKLIRELQRQQAALIVFDLHFIVSDPMADPELAAAMHAAGNVLLADCVQRIKLSETDSFDGRKCSSRNQFRQAFVEIQGKPKPQVAEQLIAMRSIPPTPLLAEAALDHAPFYLGNDVGNPVIRNVDNLYDNLAEAPSLPLLTWAYYLQANHDLTGMVQPGTPVSEWLSRRRRDCVSAPDKTLESAVEKSGPASRLDAAICRSNNPYLNFYGPPRSFQMVSFQDVYAGKLSSLQGKVVFVGKAKSKSISNNDDLDYFHTPFSNTATGNMSGVEIMATQFANLNEDRFIRPLPDFWFNTLLFAFALLITMLFTSLGWLSGMLTSLLILCSYAGLSTWCFSRYGYWLPVVIPFIQWVFICVWELSAWLPFSTSKKHVHGVCLATDIEGYTSIAEGLTPIQLDNLLAPYFKILTEPVISNSAKINDITGDAMMALWFDLPLKKQRLSACLAALEIRQAVEKFNAVNPLALPIRIGLFEGDIKIRPIHAGGKRFYRAVGNTLNIASRIEGANKILGTRILAADSIALTSSGIYFRPLGSFRVIGREDPLQLVEIIGKIQDVSATQQVKYQQFAAGLAAFQQGRWQQAALNFQALLNELGDDGPARFYLKLALDYQKKPPMGWGVVQLDQK